MRKPGALVAISSDSIWQVKSELLQLPVLSPVVFEPTVLMATSRIMMGPVDNATLGVPFVFSVELNGVGFA
jgi:hypothetical protein